MQDFSFCIVSNLNCATDFCKNGFHPEAGVAVIVW
jgi:hypothetical protein